MHLPADFDAEIWSIVAQIPAGRIATYGQLARLAGMPGYARRVGRAIAAAPAGIPCHRVVGTNGSLTGYAGGIDKKIKLLELEHTDMHGFFVPKKSTAL